MTALTISPRHPHNPLSRVILAIMILVALAIPAYKASQHMLDAHEESAMIRECAQNADNLMQVWLNSSGERLNCLIKLPGERIGNLIVQWSCRQLEFLGISAHILNVESLKQATDILRAKGCSRVW